jgi:hypothetical protein
MKINVQYIALDGKQNLKNIHKYYFALPFLEWKQPK